MNNIHPKFPLEEQRLKKTKKVIEEYLEVIKTSEKKQVQDIKQAFVDLDFLDSSQSYITILTSTQMLEYGRENYKKLSAGKEKPYFARVDFKNEGSPDYGKYYIGKFSVPSGVDREPFVIDWRAPIANIYYESRLGEATYEAPEGIVKGDLGLKRQFTINNGILENILDIDLTTNDEFLQASLDAGVDNKLKDIAATIQAEQNRIIRADINRPLIVQGVAGSGKTTIALHRIAYLIYTYEDDFIPENFLIIAPNRLFINYISEVLPELGVERVKQTTFTEVMLEVIELDCTITNPNDKLVSFINTQDGNENDSPAPVKWASAFKGSMIFKKIIDNYLDDLEQAFVPDEDLALEEYIIVPKDEIKRLFIREYGFLAFYRRVDMLKKVLSNKLKSAKEKILTEIEEPFNRKIDNLRGIAMEDQKRRDLIASLLDARDVRLMEVKNRLKNLVAQYIAKFPKRNLLRYYQDIVTNEGFIRKHITDEAYENSIGFTCETSERLISKKQIEFEDLAPLAYLKYNLYGLKEKPSIKHCVIDEAQDLSSFQIYALRKILNTDLFTIFGDLAQGIHSYRGTNNWAELINDVFSNRECNFRTLEQSYRTTIEIMELANKILKKSENRDFIYAKPVIRHGDKPIIKNFSSTDNFAEEAVREIETLKSRDYKSVAFIGKTLDECRTIKNLLEQRGGLKVDIITGDEDVWDGEVVVLPAYIAKGLEFDAVFIVSINEGFSFDELDIKLLYIAVTRARHKLYIFQTNNSVRRRSNTYG
ncbi:MAG: RNA polymerase recycling motor HelD [Carboxydocellales bacterium]